MNCVRDSIDYDACNVIVRQSKNILWMYLTTPHAAGGGGGGGGRILDFVPATSDFPKQFTLQSVGTQIACLDTMPFFLASQSAECQEECGGVGNCTNSDTSDLWLAVSGCPVKCSTVSQHCNTSR